MNTCLIIVFEIFSILLFCVLSCRSQENIELDSDECLNRVHRKCNTDESYTEEELENARVYIQQRFAITNPKGKPCDKLRVRKDIKCFSPKEVKDLTDVALKLYENGIIDKFTEIHDTSWLAAHKFSEAVMWHRYFGLEFEKEMLKINPNIPLPYWDFLTEFKSAEKSIVFDHFGHAGNKDNDYCIPDGPFANLTVNYPNRHCLRRQWNLNGTTPIWESPEWMTAVLQMEVNSRFLFVPNEVDLNPEKFLELLDIILTEERSSNRQLQFYFQFTLLAAYTGHFKTHLSLGGDNGDLSLSFAPNDLLFFLFHAYVDVIQLKWQLQRNNNLVPKTYNLGNKFHLDSQNISGSNLESDHLTYFENITVKEVFQIGYGDMCYIYDQMIKPINNIIKNKKHKLPEYVHRMRSTLTDEKFSYYFPKFALHADEVTYFDYVLPDVGKCNARQTNGFCSQIPVAQKFTETENGLRQWLRFLKGGFDLTPNIAIAENLYEQFMKDLIDNNYCSPYI